MTDEMLTGSKVDFAPTNVPPIPVTMIGTGDGTVPKNLTVAVTPGQQPNLVANVFRPLTAIFVRAMNMFFLTLSGSVTATAFLHVGDFKTQIVVAACVTGVGVIKDCATIFGRLEGKYPLATGSI